MITANIFKNIINSCFINGNNMENALVNIDVIQGKAILIVDGKSQFFKLNDNVVFNEEYSDSLITVPYSALKKFYDMILTSDLTFKADIDISKVQSNIVISTENLQHTI